MINLDLIQNYFLMFLIYSFCGWIIEIITEACYNKRFVNRGFLMGPVCPVYGFGAILITMLLSQYSNSKDYFAIFGLSMLICGTVEYFTSYVLEKIFNARWWDYSDKKFNIKGRICLENLLLFGVAGVAIIEWFNPVINNLIQAIPTDIKQIIFYLTFTLFVIDIIMSLTIIKKIRSISEKFASQYKDNTAEITRKVRETIFEKSAVYRRVLEAFPHVFADKIEQGKEKIVNVANEIKSSALEAREKTIEGFNNVKEKANYNVDRSKRLTKYRINKIKKTISKSKIMTIAKANKEKELKNEENTIDNNNINND